MFDEAGELATVERDIYQAVKGLGDSAALAEVKEIAREIAKYDAELGRFAVTLVRKSGFLRISFRPHSPQSIFQKMEGNVIGLTAGAAQFFDHAQSTFGIEAVNHNGRGPL